MLDSKDPEDQRQRNVKDPIDQGHSGGGNDSMLLH